MSEPMGSERPLVWITGASGQLGTALSHLLPESAPYDRVLTTRAEVDLTSFGQLSRFLREREPDVVINCAAYTAVDGAETLSEDELFETNTLCLMQLHELRPHLPIVQISTDYVFGGNAETTMPYVEEDVADPINRYGKSKADADHFLIANHPESYILRTAWLYGPASWGRSFYRSIRGKVEAGEPIRCVTDEVGSPTSTLTLARVIGRLLDGLTDPEAPDPLPYGLYHVADLGETSRHHFAATIARLLTGREDYPISPITQADLALPASRPHYSALSTEKIQKYYPDLLRPWEEALEEVIDRDTQR